jgi:hypothetical protein
VCVVAWCKNIRLAQLLARLPAQTHPNNLKFTARNATRRDKSRRTAGWCGHIDLGEGRGSLAMSTVLPLLLQTPTADSIRERERERERAWRSKMDNGDVVGQRTLDHETLAQKRGYERSRVRRSSIEVPIVCTARVVCAYREKHFASSGVLLHGCTFKTYREP